MCQLSITFFIYSTEFHIGKHFFHKQWTSDCLLCVHLAPYCLTGGLWNQSFTTEVGQQTKIVLLLCFPLKHSLLKDLWSCSPVPGITSTKSWPVTSSGQNWRATICLYSSTRICHYHNCFHIQLYVRIIMLVKTSPCSQFLYIVNSLFYIPPFTVSQ